MKREKAVAGTTAKYDERLNKEYLSVKSLSTLKIIIGGLLLFGNKERRAFWPLFDVLLRQLVDLRLAPKHGSQEPGATKSGKGGIG